MANMGKLRLLCLTFGAALTFAAARAAAAEGPPAPQPELLLEPMKIGEKVELPPPRVRPVFSPNGRFVAFVEIAAGKQLVVIADVAQRAIVASAVVSNDVVAGWPSWSPDSRWVGFATEGSRVAYLSIDGIRNDWRVSFYGALRGLIWQPISGTRFIVLSERAVWSIGVSGARTPRKLVLGKPGEHPTSISLTADGRKLVYCSGGRVWLTTRPTSPGNIIAAPEKPVAQLTRAWVAPDGSCVVAAGPDAADRERERAMLFGVAEGSAALLEVAGRITSVAWAPNSRAFALAANGKIFVFSASGKLLGKLVDDEATDRDPCWDPDGGRIVFSSVRRDADRNGKIDAKDPADIYLIDVPPALRG